jgi:hypothetical protein
MKRILFVLALTALCAVKSFAIDNEISISPFSIAKGGSATVSVYANLISTDLQVLEFDLNVPEGCTIETTDAKWNTYWTKDCTGKLDIQNKWLKRHKAYYFCVCTDETDVLSSGNDWLVTFKVTADATVTSADISISMVNISTSSGKVEMSDAMINVGTTPIKVPASVGEYAATFKSTGSTICAESALDFSSVSDAKLYAVSEITSTAAKLTQIEDGIADAGKGYLVMGLSGDQKIPFTESTSSYTGVNLLKGVTAPTAIASDAKIYIFCEGEFHPCTGGTLAAGKAYLDCSGVEGLAKTISIEFGDATAISNISLDEDVSAPIYNLSGMLVSKTQKGVYIRNGKKYVVK